MRSQSERRACGSSPVVGSSRKTSLGIVDERQGDRQALLLPAGKVHRPCLGAFPEVDRVDQLPGRHVMVKEASEEVQELGHGESRVERHALELDPDALLDRLGMPANVQAEHLDRPGHPADAGPRGPRSWWSCRPRSDRACRRPRPCRTLEGDAVDGLDVPRRCFFRSATRMTGAPSFVIPFLFDCLPSFRWVPAHRFPILTATTTAATAPASWTRMR